MDRAAASRTEAFEAALEEHARRPYMLRLYVAGATPASQRAVTNLTRVCDAELPGRYRLEVVDVYQRTQQAVDEQIVAVPALVRVEPRPPVRLIGDFSDAAKVVRWLDLRLGTA